MFKISKIIFNRNNEQQKYELSQNTFIYGANTVGKTAFTKILEFILASRDNTLDYQGLENIDSIEAILENGNTKIAIKRTRENYYYYKRNLESEYTRVSSEGYKTHISQILYENLGNTGKKNFIEIYKKIFEEEITFRSLSFLNFLEEKGLGDLTAVFTKTRNFNYQIRIADIMDFLFNYKNIEEIYNKKKILEKKEKELKELDKNNKKYEIILKQIDKLFNELGIKIGKNLKESKENFKKFKKELNTQEVKNFDLNYLTRISFSLLEEIKSYNFMKSQTKHVLERKIKNEKLLENFNSILLETPHYKDYLTTTKQILNKIGTEKIILEALDYNKIIKKLLEEKEKIDKQLEEARAQANRIEFEQFQKKIIILENYFKELRLYEENNLIKILEEDIKNLRKEIKNLRKNFDQENINKFNKKLTNSYLSSDSRLNHISEDKSINGFSLEFNPLKVAVGASKVENGKKKIYTTGSMARQTHIQIMTYLIFLDYLKEEFYGLSYLPLLILDSVDQPLETENFEKIYPQIIKFAEEIGVQTIVLSKTKLNLNKNSSKIIDITKGLNKFYKKK